MKEPLIMEMSFSIVKMRKLRFTNFYVTCPKLYLSYVAIQRKEQSLVWSGAASQEHCSNRKSSLRKFQRRQTLWYTIKRILCRSNSSSNKLVFLNFFELSGTIKLIWSYAAGLQTNKNSMWWNEKGIHTKMK